MKFKKLTKIYRILFPLQLTESQIFKNKLLSNPLISNIEDDNDTFIITFSKNYKVVVRNHNHSDYDVFKQIFNFEEYKMVLSFLKLNLSNTDEDVILLDCGANVGYTTIYFSKEYQFTKIFCIEPSSSNVKILKKNILKLKNSNSIHVLQNAISGQENLYFDLESNFRDGLDWSITTSINKNGSVKGITINEIVNKNNIGTITLLKIDIEGAERFIFEDTSDLSFLSITKIIAIEIHDEFQIREKIYEILKKNGYYLFESGELTLGFNKYFFYD